MTNGMACLHSHLDGLDHLDDMNWSFSSANEFHKTNKPTDLTPDEMEDLTIEIWGQEIKPTQKVLVPSSRAAYDILAQIKTADETIDMQQLIKNLGQETQCALIFNQNVPAWPSCNPLDNGQFGYELWKVLFQILK